MWPISPAPPRPSHGLPSRIRPPPTPVPQKTPTQRLVGTAGSEMELGLGRHLNVVADLHGGAELLFEPGPELERALPAGEVPGLGNAPGALVDVAGRADTHRRPGRRSRGSPPAPPPASPPPSARRRPRGHRWWASAGAPPRAPSTLPLTTTVWILVPPRSMPPRAIMRSCYSPAEDPVAANQGVGGAVVGELGLGVGLRARGRSACASTLPSSTPHWSNESMPQIAPWVKTLCSYSATSDAEGLRGEPLGEDRVGGAVALEDAVRDELARACPPRAPPRRSCRTPAPRSARRRWPSAGRGARPSGLSERPKPMKSHGISLVPWWISW